MRKGEQIQEVSCALPLDDGSGTPRQILSGIAAYYQPEELVGKTLVACTNLAPRRMMGLGVLRHAAVGGEG